MLKWTDRWSDTFSAVILAHVLKDYMLISKSCLSVYLLEVANRVRNTFLKASFELVKIVKMIPVIMSRLYE